ncbi:MAG: malate/lactate/ureidoglycolate dehydrogenase [Myxococcales bacterium]|nr:malate/lactate/ureidoglycolate dehydrogenase [Myxococcales bacterium]
MRIDHEELRNLATAICEKMGAESADARTVADHLVDANLMGHDSHGVGMLPVYAFNHASGALQPRAHAKLVSERGAVLVVDGQAGFGQVVAPEAMEMGLQRVQEHGIVAVGLRNAHHIGRVGTYGELCASRGHVSMHYVNVVGHPPMVAPYWGAEARLNTNPYCCAVPVPDDEPIVLDMATSAVAHGKVRVANLAGERVAEGLLLDNQGRPTTDPGVMFPQRGEASGALTAFGLHKGSGLSLICEVLGGALAGAWTMEKQFDGITVVNGMLTILIDPARFGGSDLFASTVGSVKAYIKGTRPAEGKQQVLVPGEPERIARKERSADGIPMSEGGWATIVEVADKLGVSTSDHISTI